MKYMIDRQEDFASIVLQEERLDTSVAPSLKGEFVFLTNEGVNNIVLDLGSVNFADSSGLSAILVGNRLTKQTGGLFVLCGITPAVKKLIEISHLDSVLAIAGNVTEAHALVRDHMAEMEEEGDEFEGEEWEEGDATDEDDDWNNLDDADLDDIEELEDWVEEDGLEEV